MGGLQMTQAGGAAGMQAGMQGTGEWTEGLAVHIEP